VHRAAFAQELRIEANAEVGAGPLSGRFLEGRDHEVAHRSRQHRAPDRDDTAAVDPREGLTDVSTNALDESRVETAVAVSRRADANHRDVGRLHGFISGGGCAQAALVDRVPASLL